MSINRIIKQEVLATANEFKAICITGPRQSGKTTLAKMLFPKKKYITLEDPDTALFPCSRVVQSIALQYLHSIYRRMDFRNPC